MDRAARRVGWAGRVTHRALRLSLITPPLPAPHLPHFHHQAYLTGLPEATKPHHRGVEAKYIDLLYGDGVALDRPVDADPHAMAASTIDALARTLSDERENALRRQERRRFLYESHGDPTAMASTGHMPRNPLSEAPRTVPESPVGGPRAPEWAALDGPSAGARRSGAALAGRPDRVASASAFYACDGGRRRRQRCAPARLGVPRS